MSTVMASGLSNDHALMSILMQIRSFLIGTFLKMYFKITQYNINAAKTQRTTFTSENRLYLESPSVKQLFIVYK